jgi:hypothetical protein
MRLQHEEQAQRNRHFTEQGTQQDKLEREAVMNVHALVDALKEKLAKEQQRLREDADRMLPAGMTI